MVEASSLLGAAEPEVSSEFEEPDVLVLGVEAVVLGDRREAVRQ